MQVYEYLVRTPAGSQSGEGLQLFFTAAEQYKFTKAECLQASNLRPSSAVEVHLVRLLFHPLSSKNLRRCFVALAPTQIVTFS